MTYQSTVLATAPTGLHRYYRFEGATAAVRDDDYSANAVDCAFSGGVTFPAGVVGTQGAEVGVSGSYVNFGFVKTGATGFAFATWYKNQGGTVVWRDASSSGGWVMLIAGADVTLRINGTNRTITGLGTTLANGSWHFVAVRSTGAAVETYVGDMAGSFALVDNWTFAANASTLSGSVFYLGRNGGNVDTHHGTYDEPVMWLTTIPSAVQLEAIYDQAIAPGVPTAVSSPSQTGTTIDLQWSAPTTGGAVDSYEVRIDGGSASTATSPHTFTGLSAGSSHTVSVRAVGPAGVSAWVDVVASTVAAPGVPTSVAVTAASETTLTLFWGAPASGGAVTSYDVRIDGGGASTATIPHTFTGLVGSTSYTVSVRAVGPGGVSAWVDVVESTTEATETGYYRAALTLGSHTWEWTTRDEIDLAADYPHVRLPLTLGWDIKDSVDFFPAQPEITNLGFAVQCNDASDLADVVKGSLVLFRMYIDANPLADPWQTFDGVVTQLSGETVVSPDDVDKRDFVVTVYAGDDNARLADKWVGYEGGDWPVEHISERVDRICDEAGIVRADLGVPRGNGMVGWLSARPEGQPISVLDALRNALKDAADDYDSEPPEEFYGRYVYQYWEANPDLDDPQTLGVYVFRRRVYDDGSPTTTLDGGLVRASGLWGKQPGPAAAHWVILDGVTFGTPDDTVPLVRNTSLLDTTSVPGDPTNHSATERDNLGESLLADGSTALDGWASRSLIYEAWREGAPELIPLWVSPQANRGFLVTPVVITPIGPELELNAVDYVAGTLTGARLLLPPGGRFVVEFRLRAELLPNTTLP